MSFKTPSPAPDFLTLKKSEGKFHIVGPTGPAIEFQDFPAIWRMAHLAHGTFNEKMKRMIRQYDKPVPERSSMQKRVEKQFLESLEVFQMLDKPPRAHEPDPSKLNEEVTAIANRLEQIESFEYRVEKNGPGQSLYNILNAFLRSETPRTTFLKINSSSSKLIELQESEMTQNEFFRLFGFNPSNFSESAFCARDHSPYLEINGTAMCADFPVESLSWNDLQILLKNLNRRASFYFYALPTIQDWDSAVASDERSSNIHNMPDLAQTAWWIENSDKQPHAVKTREPIKSGFFDLFGNVWELMNDTPGWSSQTAAMRGGSWGSLHAEALRVKNIREVDKDFRGYQIGFRFKRVEKN